MNKMKKILAVILCLVIAASIGSVSLIASADEGNQTTTSDLRATDPSYPTQGDIVSTVQSVVESLIPSEERESISSSVSNLVGGDEDEENGGKTGLIGIFEDMLASLRAAIKSATEWLQILFAKLGIK